MAIHFCKNHSHNFHGKATFVIVVSIITGGVLLLVSGGQENFMAWGQVGEAVNLLEIFHGGAQEPPLSAVEETNPGDFTAGSPTGDPNTPYDFQPMKLRIIVPSEDIPECESDGPYPVNQELPEGVMLLDEDGTNTMNTLKFEETRFVQVKAMQPSQHLRDIVIKATTQGCAAIEDVVKATAVAIDGKFRIIGDQNAPYYHEEQLTGVTEEDEIFFRTLGGMRLHLQVTLPPEDVEEYAWGTTGGDFFQNYSTTVQPLGPAASKGADLKEIYWEGEYRPDLDITITVRLKIKGMEESREITRTIKSRVLREKMKGDDVEMLQAYLRQMGVSCGQRVCTNPACKYGGCGTLITVNGSFDPGTKEAVIRIQTRDESSPYDGVPGQKTLSKIQLHWTDYLKAFEAYPDFPFIKPPNPNPKEIQQEYNIWLKEGAEELADTYSDEFVMKVDPEHAFYTPADPFTCFGCNESRERLLDTWIKKEASKGHWGYNKDIPFRIVLGECDNRGSIGFSQIQNRFRYGADVADEFKNVNLYHPGDNVRGFAIWSNSSDGDMGRGFYYAFKTNRYALPTPSSTYPRLVASYFRDEPLHKKKREESEATDTLSKGLATYKEGPGVGNNMLFRKSWPEILRQHPKVGDVDTSIEKAIAYPLTIRGNAGLFVNRTWTWEVKVITVGPDGKCQTTKEGDDEQVLNVGDESEPHAVAIIGGIPGGNETLDTRIKVCFTEAEYDAFSEPNCLC